MNGFKFLLILLVAGGLLGASVLADTTASLRPTTDGTDDSADWENSSAIACNTADCYIEVDESSGGECTNSDGDTSYISSLVNGASQTFGINESSISDGSTITEIAITTCFKRGKTGAAFQTRYCHNGSCTDSGTTITAGRLYAENTQIHTVNFIKTSGSDIEIGLTSLASKEVRVSQISAVITYTPVPICGDGNIDAGEECDDGVNNGQVCTPAYGSTCDYCSGICQTIQLTGPYCGDGIENGPEECDDGNTNNGDGCSATCQIETPPPGCGDGNIDAGEECDDGANNGNVCTPPYGGTCDYCSNACQAIQLTGPFCGDGITNGNEGCDDGNTNNGDGCSATCQIEGGEPSAPSEPPPGEGRRVRVAFSGRAYPSSKIEVLRRGSKDEEATYFTVPFESHDVSPEGKFDLILGALVNDEYFLALRAEDKEGRKTSIIGFNIDLRTTSLLEVKDIFFQPTFELSKEVVSRGKSLDISGYAAPNADIEMEVAGLILKSAKSDSEGYWSASLETGALSSGQYSIKIKQIDSLGIVSRSTVGKRFKVSLLNFPEIDFNNDDIINITDWSVFLYRWGSENDNLKNTIDLNSDGEISVQDFSIFLNAMKL